MSLHASFEQSVSDALADFGARILPRLSAPGRPEADEEAQLYGPLENFLEQAVQALGLNVVSYHETRLRDYGVRPDYALSVDKAVVGYIEVKKPGRGVDPESWPRKSHDYRQWEKLKLLPNLLYTDGNQWALYRDGSRVGEVAHVTGEVRRSGRRLAPTGTLLLTVLYDFATWRPETPRTVEQLVRSTGRLCRLLREEVLEALRLEKARIQDRSFSLLADDWRNLLFPDASEEEFADGYAQTVTFALLLARYEGIDFENRTTYEIGQKMRHHQALMGKALTILTDQLDTGFDTAVQTLVRVIGAVDFHQLANVEDELHKHFYERFLEEYHPAWRRKTGAYYTPDAVTSFIVSFTDDLLRSRLGKSLGFATKDVVVVDPCMGTGSFLAEIVDRVEETVATEQGDGAVPASLHQLVERLVGIEKQIGPFAVAEWRIHRKLRQRGALKPHEVIRLYVNDTLTSPDEGPLKLPSGFEDVMRSKREADRLKRGEPVIVVLGNPPWEQRAKGQGHWIEKGDPKSGTRPPLDDFREPGLNSILQT